jgi:hypothetical protein
VQEPHVHPCASLALCTTCSLIPCPRFCWCPGFARKWNGPDSEYAEFETDTCSAPLGLPSCAQWLPDEKMVLFKYMWDRLPRVSSQGTSTYSARQRHRFITLSLY